MLGKGGARFRSRAFFGGRAIAMSAAFRAVFADFPFCKPYEWHGWGTAYLTRVLELSAGICCNSKGRAMSGHSKWATTKHRKAAQDAKRSALFSKLSRNITVAAKEGGDPNPDNNASLAAAIEKAKGYSLPKDKIKTAIDKAFGSGKDAANYETVVYEGYGPCGVAIPMLRLTARLLIGRQSSLLSAVISCLRCSTSISRWRAN